MPPAATPKSLRRRVLIAAAAATLVLAGAAAFFGLRTAGPALAEECRAAKPVADRLAPLARGEIAALAVAATPALPPAFGFSGPDGQALGLPAFAGRTVLVNLWATWCIPCRQEMPALDKLQADLGGPEFEVVAINVDTRNPDKPRAWLKEAGIGNLAYYADPGGKLLQVLQRSGDVVGLPTTLLIDRTGCQVAVLKGPAEWASPEAAALIRSALER